MERAHSRSTPIGLMPRQFRSQRSHLVHVDMDTTFRIDAVAQPLAASSENRQITAADVDRQPQVVPVRRGCSCRIGSSVSRNSPTLSHRCSDFRFGRSDRKFLGWSSPITSMLSLNRKLPPPNFGFNFVQFGFNCVTKRRVGLNLKVS